MFTGTGHATLATGERGLRRRGLPGREAPTGLVPATATRWRAFSTLPPALWVLASTLLAATIIHQG
jgi:hypothetical protein